MSKKQTNLSPEQDKAANPELNIWVQANAGTGKTSVLVQRLLRILFRAPHEKSGILCLTYTNAGAAEMRNRILAALRNWAVMPADDLRDLLTGVADNNPPTDADIKTARTIFYEYIDNPAILKIRTIHGFCEEILRRFPLEAGIPAAWNLVSGAEQKKLQKDAAELLLSDGRADKNLQDSFEKILSQITESSFDGLLDILVGQYRKFFNPNFNSRDKFIDNTYKFLNITEIPRADFYNPAAVQNRVSIPDALAQEKKSVGYLTKISNALRQFLIDGNFEDYATAWLTNAGTIVTHIRTKGYLNDEADMVFNLYQQIANQKILENSIALYDLTAAFAAKYKQVKLSRCLLDFDDLILYTNRLFSDPTSMGWVLSQLDLSLHHILVDEAQDTSPEQWEILRSLTTNFFDIAQQQNPRTLFVVGDTKQSIFSFQGAAPESFAESKDAISQQITNDFRQITPVPLSQSFRSTAPVLHAVDAFFNDKSIIELTKFQNNPHKCFRAGDKGLVRINPLKQPETEQNTATARREYLNEIADKISELIKGGENPADIMVLVQRRNPFAAALITALQTRNIPVAGSDRINLPNFPAVRDLLNLVRVCLNPADDYSLCCVLKSPLYRLTERDIFNLCAGRKETVYERLSAELSADFDMYREWSEILPPYSFFMRVLNHNDNRKKIIAALGNQVIDPLEEFMTICLSYERTHSGMLREFCEWFINGETEIKREMERAAGVRVMTVHSSKGLDSKIVFLIDTVSTPANGGSSKISRPIEIKGGWLWRGNADPSEQFNIAKSDRDNTALEEYYRLLYVAMTRAKDQLHIYGFSRLKKESVSDSWHSELTRVLKNASDAVITADGAIEFRN